MTQVMFPISKTFQRYLAHQQWFDSMIWNQCSSFFAISSTCVTVKYLPWHWTVQMRSTISFTCKRSEDTLEFLSAILQSVQVLHSNEPIFFYQYVLCSELWLQNKTLHIPLRIDVTRGNFDLSMTSSHPLRSPLVQPGNTTASHYSLPFY